MKVYVITAGEYSAYHICAVTTDPVSAENLRLLYSDGWHGVASIETFDTEELPNRPKTCWSIGVSDDGLIFRCFERSILDDDYDNGKEVDINQVIDDGYGEYNVYVIADDEEHARKIACDLIAQHKYEHKVEKKRPEGMKAYYYWLTERRVAPGAFPEEGLLKVSNFLHQSPIEGIGLAWGAVLYNRELSLDEIFKYKLKYGGETEE